MRALFVRTQHELSVPSTLKVLKLKTQNFAQENNGYLNRLTDW